MHKSTAHVIEIRPPSSGFSISYLVLNVSHPPPLRNEKFQPDPQIQGPIKRGRQFSTEFKVLSTE